MWTVGRSNFGENEKHPAVMEALERMVEAVYKARQMAENARLARLARPKVGSPCPYLSVQIRFTLS